MSYLVKFPALRIERRFANEIFEGRKFWEFRKRPLDIAEHYLLCSKEEDDVAIGSVSFSHIVGTYRGYLLDVLRSGDFRPWSKFTGLQKGWLEGYAKPYELVWAHLVQDSARFDAPVFGTYRNGALSIMDEDLAAVGRIRDKVRRCIQENRISRFDLYLQRKRKRSAAIADSPVKAAAKELAKKEAGHA